jgi:hypothetical protein
MARADGIGANTIRVPVVGKSDDEIALEKIL